ncbi:MAG: radical SAM protein [Thermoplasmata archaeon]|nr:MAG: radical SAM protein [Thermoplasmata archaeon]
MLIAILDGYIDEPACLGVPPYISPHVRYLAGAIKSSGQDYIYITIDEYRNGSAKCKKLESCDIIIVVAGAVVPGKYLGGSPMSYREAGQLAEQFKGITILGGGAGKYGFFSSKTGEPKRVGSGLYRHQCTGDIDACFFDFINGGEFTNRLRTLSEQNSWAIQGAEVVQAHPNFPDRLMAEIESYRGCTRYGTGGCSFCIEPDFGEPQFREQKDIIGEVEKLNSCGVHNFRVGGQSCIYSYKSKGVGALHDPKPNPPELKKLFSALRSVIGPSGILHVDNANPAVIAQYPGESEKITKTLVEYCTSGNVVAFGMESADPAVIHANNLNAAPEQVMAAVLLVNKFGKDRGETGLPKLLPGLNFISGLKGESKRTYQLNREFLDDLMSKGLMLRRINIRQVAMTRRKFKAAKLRREFMRFKKYVREEIDRPMLERVVPEGTILHDVIVEAHEGNVSFGRQLGSYPILVGVSYKIPSGTKLDVYILSFGFRSITGVEVPFRINSASLNQLKALPGIGAKRAARVVRARPFGSAEELQSVLEDKDISEKLLKIISFE